MGNPINGPWVLRRSLTDPISSILLSFFHHKVFKLDFTQLPLSMGCQCIFVAVCMLSGWVDAFLCLEADALTETKRLLQNVFPTPRRYSFQVLPR